MLAPARIASPMPETSGRAQLRRILALARPEKRRIALGTLCLLVGSGMALLYPQGIRLIIDGALGHGGAPIDRAALFLLGVFLVAGAAVPLRAMFFSIAGERIVADLGTRVYRALVAQEIGFSTSGAPAS